MLETTWFVLWAVLWGAYFMLDGYSLGIGMLLPFLARGRKERGALANSIAPFWDGNEVWLIAAGGVTFAAFPGTYATMFSALYSPLLLILFGLILRGAALGFRGEVEKPGSKMLCDILFFIGSFVPTLLFGVAFANIFAGIPIDGDRVFQGTTLTLLNPYGLAGGVLFTCFFAVHGLLWLTIKTEGQICEKAARWVKKGWWALLAVASGFLIATAFATNLYANYLAKPALFLIPIGAVVALIVSGLMIRRGSWIGAWWASAFTIFLCTIFGVIGMFPALLPSSLDPAFSRTIANSASSPLTLKIMLGVILIFIPLVIVYQFWAYSLFAGKSEGEENY
ncbi:cytochrome d ubiquinol oxidase subunit II [bacterium]|nr:cytochrome d ubiquinol oxidase subunit II [bacterium]